MSRRLTAFALISISLILLLAGCAMTPKITPVPNREVIDLSADDMIIMLLRAGLTEQQIYDMGPEIRNALAGTGAARVSLGNRTETVFTVVQDYVYVTSQKRGSFIYDSKQKTCR